MRFRLQHVFLLIGGVALVFAMASQGEMAALFLGALCFGLGVALITFQILPRAK